MKNINMIKIAVTHSATFHADETLGVALLQLLNPEIEVIRTIDRGFIAEAQNKEDTIVFDIGFGEYDHHQPEKALRHDGTPYCAAGLLWRDYGHLLCPDDRPFAKVDRELFLPIDKADNGVEHNPLSTALYRLNPVWDAEDSNTEPGFWKTVEIQKTLLKAAIESANAEERARKLVLASQIVDDVLILNRYMPWQPTVVEELPSVKFVVFPSNRGGYSVQTVPLVLDGFVGRVPFPSRWLGNPDRSLGMTFCHVGNFLASTETLDQAINVAKIAIAEAK